MKKNIIGLVVLLLLAATSYYVYQQRGTGTIKPDLHNFAVKDTASVTKIFLADKSGNTILLERQQNKSWTVNKNHKARKDAVDVLLATIKRVEMKAPVSKAAHDNIVRLLAGKSIKVEIYQNDKKTKTYYVGDATKDHLGTNMLMEGSATPFTCHIPGFYGYLTARYFTRAKEWRDTEIFNYRLPQIAEIKVEFHQTPERSFRITHSKDRVVQLFRLFPSEEKVERMDTVFVKRYMTNYRNIRYEGIQPYQTARVDSIVKSPKYFTITVTNPQGEISTVTSYRIPSDPNALVQNREDTDWDPDRMHATINGDESEIMLIQYFSFDWLTTDILRLQIDPNLRRDN